MAKRKGYLTVNRQRHGFLWWLLIGWWERPLASAFWLLITEMGGYSGVRYHYYK